MNSAQEARILHTLPGRVRINVPAISTAGAAAVEERLRQLAGVSSVRASDLTSNVVVEFDDQQLDADALMEPLREISPGTPAGSASTARPALRKPADSVLETHSSARRARVAVRGLDRDPDLGRRLVERLSRRPEVMRVTPSPLTGRVLVEVTEGAKSLQEILDEIADLELPAAEEEAPAHPLDPAPIIEGGAKAIGAGLGLLMLLVRQIAGSEGPPLPGPGPGEIAGAVGLVEGIPALSHRIEDGLGRRRKELFFGATAIVAMSASGNPLGLAFAGAVGLRLLTESLERRRAWRDYEGRIGDYPDVHPGAVLRLAPGQRSPMRAIVLEGFGLGSALDGSPQALFPGATVDPGARIHGGAVTVKLGQAEAFEARPLPAPSRAAPVDRYLHWLSYGSLLYALATGLTSRSPARTLTALLLVNPVPALAGRDSADRSACARAIRSGVVVVGSRRGRPITRPDVVMLHDARTLCRGWELIKTVALDDRYGDRGVLELASAVSACAGSPWGITLPITRIPAAADGAFDGRVASAEVAGERWLLEPGDRAEVPERLRADEYTLMLRRQRDGLRAGALILRPRLARDLELLKQTCRTLGVSLELMTSSRSPWTERIAERAGVTVTTGDPEQRVFRLGQEGRLVAVVGDSVRSAAAFDRCGLAIALSSGRSGRFLARADLLAPSLDAVAAVLQAGARRDAAVRDSVLVSIGANLGGAVWGVLRQPPFRIGNRPAHIGGLVAMADGAVRLWGGRRARGVTERLADPAPERWGRESVQDVLRALHTTRRGLSSEEARRRWRARPQVDGTDGVAELMLDQVKSPLFGVLGLGAALSAAMGALGDVVMIAAVVVANAAVGAWQEKQADSATRALHKLSASHARVLRDGRLTTVTQEELVPGDVILLASGDRIPADARLISGGALEVDEASLTGESIPVLKAADGATDSSRVLLEGTDVVTGAARAVAVAVGEHTRMGAIQVALGEDFGGKQSPLDDRLGRMLVRALPWIGVGGAVVTAAGILRGRSPLAQFTLGASVAIAAVPEGLPLLAGVAEAAVAQRLASRKALVTRLSAVEALGRVDVACADKTGTLTTGTLELTLVADATSAEASPRDLTPALRAVLSAAAIASPSPDAADAHSHPTDVAVLRAARLAGLHDGLGDREAESRFDPTRSFHATQVGGYVRVKGAVAVLAERCARVRLDGRDAPLDHAGRAQLLDRAAALAHQGLRILLVAEGPPAGSVDDPWMLTALGFIGISDPLRPGATAAVQRCREAGIRVVMLTGDHPATALAIATKAGLPAEPDRMLTGEEVSGLDTDALTKRLERATIIARITPLQKLRIVETLRGAGHVVAMTGDGVNDAPALRLADVGVAMGHGGTEVARQAADLVLVDDEFATLAEALVEGRGFWHNMRSALGLLLGGNAGEVGLMIASALTGLATPLTTRQVLTVNLVTDVFPAVSVAIQPPEHRNLAELSREGAGGLDSPLRSDIIRRGIATATPSFAAYLLASRLVGRVAARSVAYVSIVTTQLAQTLDLGQAKGRLTSSVLVAGAGSLAVLAATFVVPPLRSFLGLSSPTGAGLLLAGGASLGSVALARALPLGRSLAPSPA